MITLTQEQAAIARFIQDNFNKLNIYYEFKPQDFKLPAISFESQDSLFAKDTTCSHKKTELLFAKVFANLDSDASNIASEIANKVWENNLKIPLYSKEGKMLNNFLNLKDCKVDNMQIQFTWYYSYLHKKPEVDKIQDYHLSPYAKGGVNDAGRK